MPARFGQKAEAFALSLLLAASLGFWPALAQTNADPVSQSQPEAVAGANGDALAETDPQTALQTIQNSIQLSNERAQALRSEIEALGGDSAKQSAALIAAGQRVKLAEIEISDVEDRLDRLIIDEFEVRGRLDGADASIANVLSALERISRNPPPALIVDPSDALGSARGALLMASILPQLKAKADGVTADLTHLSEIKAAALQEEELLKANFAVLEEEQLRIATLILARKQGAAILQGQLETEEQDALDLATRASGLKATIAALESRVNAVSAASALPEGAPPLKPR